MACRVVGLDWIRGVKGDKIGLWQGEWLDGDGAATRRSGATGGRSMVRGVASMDRYKRDGNWSWRTEAARSRCYRRRRTIGVVMLIRRDKEEMVMGPSGASRRMVVDVTGAAGWVARETDLMSGSQGNLAVVESGPRQRVDHKGTWSASDLHTKRERDEREMKGEREMGEAAKPNPSPFQNLYLHLTKTGEGD